MRRTRRKMSHEKLDGLEDRIRMLVYESDKSQYALEAEMLGRKPGELSHVFSRWLNEHSSPNAYYLAAICKYFDVSADWLLGLSDRRERE